MPLHTQHAAANALFTDIGGWDIPLHYGSVEDEYAALMNSAGVFDLSYLTLLDLLGAGGRQFLRHLLSNDVDTLNHVGQALTSCILNHQGAIIDEARVYFRRADTYRLISSATKREAVLAWIQQHIDSASVGIQTHVDSVMLSVHGPQARAILCQVLTPHQMDALTTLQLNESVEIDDVMLACVPFGEQQRIDLILPLEQAPDKLAALLAKGAKLCGYAARQDLFTQQAVLLDGYKKEDSILPLESRLTHTVAFEPSSRDFIGKAALALAKEAGIQRQLVKLVTAAPMLQPGQKLLLGDKVIGHILQVAYSPSPDSASALAIVNRPIGDNIMLAHAHGLSPVTLIEPTESACI